MGLRLKEGIACRRYAIMVANMRRNITRIFGKKLINHHIIAILKRWHHRENNRWGFVNTIIAYLRHASGGGVATPGWQHLRRYQPGANHNRVPPARCSLHSPHRCLCGNIFNGYKHCSLHSPQCRRASAMSPSATVASGASSAAATP